MSELPEVCTHCGKDMPAESTNRAFVVSIIEPLQVGNAYSPARMLTVLLCGFTCFIGWGEAQESMSPEAFASQAGWEEV